MASGTPPGVIPNGPPYGILPDSALPPLTYSYNGFLEAWMLSVMLSAISYGVAFSLTWSCINLLQTMAWTGSTRKFYFLQTYILFMFALSTGSIASSVITMTKAVFAKTPFLLGNPLGQPGTVCIVLANWGADGFLLWRCIMLYQGISSDVRRRASFVGIAALGLLSLFVGVFYLHLTFIGNMSASLILFAFACTSLFVNLSITCLITIRITYLTSSVKTTFGQEHVSIYRRIVSMVVESAALVVVAYTAYVVLTLAFPLPVPIPLKSLAGLVPMMSLTQIYVIATLLIVYRVAQGREAENTDVEDLEFSSRGDMTLKFATNSHMGMKPEDDYEQDLEEMDFVRRSKISDLKHV